MTERVRLSPQSRTALLISVLLVVLLMVPATMSLMTVETPNGVIRHSKNPTPYGYTVALLFWAVPAAAVAFWLLPSKQRHVERRAFWITVAMLLPVGFLGEFFLVYYLWDFPNLGATMGIMAPAMGSPVPLEEYLFYILAFICALLIYIWLDEYWMSAYQSTQEPKSKLIQFHPLSLIVAVLLIGAAIVWKKFIVAEPGFPLYFTFQVVAVLLPCAVFLPTAQPMINFRAFTLTSFFILMVSLMWEVTLAIPYQWWSYHNKSMMGIYIKGWSNLPIEAVILWIAGSWLAVVVYHVVRLYVKSGAPLKIALFGSR